jgi:hypothetical protein
MKKSIILAAACILLAVMASGQTFYRSVNEATGNKPQGTQGSREGLECPPGTLYSHTFNTLDAYTSWTGTPYTVFDQLASTPAAPINEITFFGCFYGSPGRNFQISFYQDNAGLPGTQIVSYTTFIAGTNTGVLWYGYELYGYSYTLPASLSLIGGNWVSVRADGSDYWYWMTASGGDGCLYQENGTGFNCTEGDVAFCLGGGAVTPVSNWALFIGIGLILAFAVVRFRKMV